MKQNLFAKILNLKKINESALSYPGTSFLICIIILGNILAFLYRGLMKPLSAYYTITMLDLIPFFTYFLAHCTLEHIFVKVQLVFELIAIIILGTKIEKKIDSYIMIAIFFLSNIIGGVFSVFFDMLVSLISHQRKYMIYVGNYAGIMSLLCIYTFYRPKSKEFLLLILPGAIPLPYRSKSLNILFINLGIALAFLYFSIIPFSYICFQAILVVYPISYMFFVVCIRKNLYSDHLSETIEI